MALIGIQGYAIPHGSKNGEGGTTIIYNTGGNVPSDLNVTTINASKGNIKLLTGTSMSYDDASIDYLSGEEARLNKISGQDLNYNNGKIGNLSSTGISTNTLDTQEMNAIKAWVQSLMSENITTDYLTVTKQAHFFELIIDKVKSVGGTLLITATNCIADYVKALKTVSGSLVETTLDDVDAEYYDVYWLATGTDGRENKNEWEVNDQAYCQSFNVKAGTSYDTTNKYYWRLVTEKLQDTIMNLSNGETIEQTPMEDPDYNSLYIYLPRLYWNANDYTDDSWEVNVTDDDRVYWEQVALQSNKFCGIMGTTDTVNGIVLTPAANSDLVNTIPTKLSFYCYKPNTQQRPPTLTPARLNVTVTYINGAIEVFTAPVTPSTQYDLTLSVGLPIANVVITNADEVSWKTVHGIRLSNVSGQYDETAVTGTASIPSIGDNICQLGYRWTQGDANEKSRGNAIIIAAQKSPDAGCQSSAIGEQLSPIKPPSYAQYEAIGSDSNHYFDLAYYRKTYMDGTGSKFFGQFYAISQGPQGQQATPIGATNVYTAYATKDDKSDMTLTPNPNVAYEYIGICITNSPTAPLTPASYEWSKISDVKYKLVDQGSTAYTKLYKDNGVWKKQLNISLAYKIMRFEGTSTSYLTVGDVRTWPQLKYDNNNYYGYISKTPTASDPSPSRTNYTGFFPYAKYTKGFNSSAKPYYYQFKIDDYDGTNQHDTREAVLTSTFSSITDATKTDHGEVVDNPNPNITNNKEIMVVLANVGVWATPWDTGRQNDPQYFEPDAIFYSAGVTPSSPPVKILDIIQDSVTVKVAPESASYLSVMNDQILMSSGNAEQISQLSVGVQGIQADCFGPQGLQSQMVQTAAGIQSQVTNGIQGVQSQISQTATGIQAEIWGPQGVQGKLQRTGVDITNGNINLQADKVTFSSSSTGTQGVQSGKVWIDSNYGTLHAVNGDFSGKVTANLVYSPTIYLLQSGGTQLKHTINPETDATPFYICEQIDQYIKIMLPKTDVKYDGLELSFYVKQGSSGYGVLVYQNSNEGSGFRKITGRKWNVLTSKENILFEAPAIIYESNPSNPSSGNPFYATGVTLGFNQVVTFKQIGDQWYVITGRATAGVPENW